MAQVHKVHQRSSQFFAVNYKDFRDDLREAGIKQGSPPFVELSFKCCGYGYFDEAKTRMLRNFFRYLSEALQLCINVTALKIVFNGFDIEEKQIQRMCQPIKQVIQQQRLKTIWIHTTNLHRCRIKDIQEMFNIIDKFGIKATSEQISIQMADWEFQKQYPSYQQLFKVFMDFDANIPEGMSLNFRKFRLQISSWYMKEKQAYSFLKDTLDLNRIKRHFESSNEDEREGNAQNRLASVSKLKGDERQQAAKSLDEYLHTMDQVSLFQQLPSKKRFKEQHQNMKRQQDSASKRMKQSEAIISSRLMKYPMEFIRQLRVDQFQQQMMTVIVGLIYRMPVLQDFQIDMRNWNAMFALGNLKKKLDTKVSSRQQFSIIRRGLGIMSRNFSKKPNAEQDPEKVITLKAVYTM